MQASGGIRTATPTGVLLADGLEAPLPGMYILDWEDRIQGTVNLRGDHVREQLLEALVERH